MERAGNGSYLLGHAYGEACPQRDLPTPSFWHASSLGRLKQLSISSSVISEEYLPLRHGWRRGLSGAGSHRCRRSCGDRTLQATQERLSAAPGSPGALPPPHPLVRPCPCPNHRPRRALGLPVCGCGPRARHERLMEARRPRHRKPARPPRTAPPHHFVRLPFPGTAGELVAIIERPGSCATRACRLCRASPCAGLWVAYELVPLLNPDLPWFVAGLLITC